MKVTALKTTSVDLPQPKPVGSALANIVCFGRSITGRLHGPVAMQTQRLSIKGRVFGVDDPSTQEVLAQVHNSAERPRCLCVPGGIEMYVSRHGPTSRTTSRASIPPSPRRWCASTSKATRR